MFNLVRSFRNFLLANLWLYCLLYLLFSLAVLELISFHHNWILNRSRIRVSSPKTTTSRLGNVFIFTMHFSHFYIKQINIHQSDIHVSTQTLICYELLFLFSLHHFYYKQHIPKNIYSNLSTLINHPLTIIGHPAPSIDVMLNIMDTSFT